MGFFDTIPAQRRGGGHKLFPPPPPVYIDEDSAAITKSNKQVHHKSKSLFYSQTASSKSVLMMIGAALILLTFSSGSKNLQRRFRSSSTNSFVGAASLAADTPENMDFKVQHPPTRLSYTVELASRAVEPTVWTCGKNDRYNQTALDPITNQRPFFAFVHVYKTAGSTLREFFTEYATICKKSLAIVQTCRGSGVEKCRLKSVNAPQKQLQRVNRAILHDHYDILGGHFSFGMADSIFSNATATTTTTTATTAQNENGAAAQEVRYMVFLRQPMTRYVSHVLYQQNTRNKHRRETVQVTAEDIKKRIRSSRGKGEYLNSIYKYLLTPAQRAMKYDQEQTREAVVTHKAQLSIDNLVRYNAIVGMTETFSQSMHIFEHAMGHNATATSASARKEEEVQGLFSRYIGEEVSINSSKRKSISTGSVLKELNKDDEFMVVFREFVKYEQLIVDFAMDMHQKQYDAVQ